VENFKGIRSIGYIIILTLSQPVFSQISDADNELLQSLANGTEVVFNDSTFKLIPKGKVSAAGTVNLNDQNIVWSNQLGGYHVIVEAIPGRTIAQTNENSSFDGYQLAYNETTRKIAVITGNIIVNLKSNIDAESIASDYNLSIANDFPRIQRAFFKVENQSELASKLIALNADYRVIEATLEMMEHFHRAR
jgi:hypothetical protein|tara:strand:- start:839 stop:1414 length:576 start_codon:yes stop_codon:yes gene_type:complete